MDDSERSVVPRAQADTMEGQGGVTKSTCGGGGRRVLDKELCGRSDVEMYREG